MEEGGASTLGGGAMVDTEVKVVNVDDEVS
jgi:hypothetical protein